MRSADPECNCVFLSHTKNSLRVREVIRHLGSAYRSRVSPRYLRSRDLQPRYGASRRTPAAIGAIISLRHSGGSDRIVKTKRLDRFPHEGVGIPSNAIEDRCWTRATGESHYREEGSDASRCGHRAVVAERYLAFRVLVNQLEEETRGKYRVDETSELLHD